MQRKTAAGNDIRQFPILIYKFVEIKIIVAHHKLYIYIRKLGLNVGRVFFIHCSGPQIHSDCVRIFFCSIVCTTTRKHRYNHGDNQQ